jgi:hypothetical protein
MFRLVAAHFRIWGKRRPSAGDVTHVAMAAGEKQRAQFAAYLAAMRCLWRAGSVNRLVSAPVSSHVLICVVGAASCDEHS